MQKLEIYAQRALDYTRKIIGDFGPRLTGSSSCLSAADSLAAELEGFADTSGTEDFRVRPGAFLGWVRLLVALYTVCVGLVWAGYFLVSTALLAIGILVMVLEFFFYRETIDPFFPAKTGRNVIGVIEPAGEVRRQVIFSGHHDSAHVFNFLVHQPSLYPLRINGGIGSVIAFFLYSFTIAILGFFDINPSSVVLVGNWVALASLTLVLQLWFFASPKGTPGAGDNLISSAAAWELGRYWAERKREGTGLHHTRIVVASWDSEEAGLRGARAYAKKHRDELGVIPTYNFNVDCPYKLTDIMFLTSDINCSVELSADFASRCLRISEEKGYGGTAKGIEFLTGGTDAGELAKVGVQATTLLGMPWGNGERSSVYHTPNDLPEAIEPGMVAAVIDIGITVAEQLDAEE